MQQPPKKKMLTPERVNEVADSLMDSANRKKKLAYEQKSISEERVKKGDGDKQVTFIVETGKGKMPQGTGPTYNERMKIAEKAKKEASVDSANAARYRRLALKAMKK
jgi:hypothetical protein